MKAAFLVAAVRDTTPGSLLSLLYLILDDFEHFLLRQCRGAGYAPVLPFGHSDSGRCPIEMFHHTIRTYSWSWSLVLIYLFLILMAFKNQRVWWIRFHNNNVEKLQLSRNSIVSFHNVVIGMGLFSVRKTFSGAKRVNHSGFSFLLSYRREPQPFTN